MTGDPRTVSDVYDQVLQFHAELKTEYQALHALALRSMVCSDRIEHMISRLQTHVDHLEKRIVVLEKLKPRPRKARSDSLRSRKGVPND